MADSTLLIALVLLSLCLIGIIILLLKSKTPPGKSMIDEIRLILQGELKENRLELASSMKENREELSNGLNALTQKLEEKLTEISEKINEKAKYDREELTQSLKNFSDQFNHNVAAFNTLQKEKFEAMAVKQNELIKTTESKLERMRETVDEKLHKTLEERLGQSFELVSKRLEEVQHGLGEMKNLASGVGDLKKVLSNVKTRGVLGEIQLGNILEQIMAPEQYETNVKTKSGSNDHVEFAIKLPGKDTEGKTDLFTHRRKISSRRLRAITDCIRYR